MINDIMSATFFYQLLLCALNMAIFLVSLQSCPAIYLLSFTSWIGIISVLLPTFVICNLSEHLTTALYSIGDIFYNFHWYRLSQKQQKAILLNIQRSQKEFRMAGFGFGFECFCFSKCLFSFYIFFSVCLPVFSYSNSKSKTHFYYF